MLAVCLGYYANAGVSVYTHKFDDPRGVFFTADDFGIRADGKTDVSDSLQAAVNRIKSERGFGTLYLPEGKYLISRTIYVPGAIRIVGYGAKRPEIILGKNTPGFDKEPTSMIWFTDGIVTDPNRISDASAGTFYSGMSNVDIRIEKGNPMAIGLRTHYAQHGNLSHVSIYGGDAYACLYEVGNEMEDVDFLGAQYGINSDTTSPSWPMAMVDVYFEGQKKAAIVTRNAGLAIVNMKIKNAPVAVLCDEKRADRLFIEDSYFENVQRGIVVTAPMGATNQVTVKNVWCKNVPSFASFEAEGTKFDLTDKSYKVKFLAFGLFSNEMGDDSYYDTVFESEPAPFPASFERTVPALPDMTNWVSVASYGAVGDGDTDDTRAIQKALDENDAVFFPEGWYRITSTIKLHNGSKLIGLHPFSTQLVLAESTPAFSGFGSPVPMVESSEGGDDIINGIGICTGGYNKRAVGLKWMAGEKSLVNDVKFVGGHGTMYRPEEQAARFRSMFGSFGSFGQVSSPSNPIAVQGLDQAWDNQYWSLWITNGGGGTFKDIWTANTYAAAGLYVSHTHTPSRMMAISLEHHVRFESRWNDVSNFKVYAMQYEEESREGKDCVAMTMDNCSDITFANTWFYRVIRVMTPRDYGTLVSNCSNIVFHNTKTWTQVICETGALAYDMNKNVFTGPLDLTYGAITGSEKSARSAGKAGDVVKIGKGYEFPTGAVTDSRGNVYFCEGRLMKVYKWDAQTQAVTVVADYPYRPISLAVDTKDNLIVFCRYQGQPGFAGERKLTSIDRMAGNYSDYSGWGNGSWSVLAYSVNPSSVSDTMKELVIVPTSSVKAQRIIYPSHSLRTDFLETYEAKLPQESWLAEDGVTIIPYMFDYCRSIDLQAVTPGQKDPVFISWENPRMTYKFNVNADGTLSYTGENFERGEYGMAVDGSGNVYLGEGQIFVLDKDFKEKRRINMEERPITMTVGGTDGEYLFVTTNSSLYRINL